MSFYLFCDNGIVGHVHEGGQGTIASAFSLWNEKGELLKECCILQENKTNNYGELQAISLGVSHCAGNNYKDILVLSDSEFSVKAIKGEYEVTSENCLDTLENAKQIIETLNYEIKWIPRELNVYADYLTAEKLQEFRKTKKKIGTKEDCLRQQKEIILQQIKLKNEKPKASTDLIELMKCKNCKLFKSGCTHFAPATAGSKEIKPEPDSSCADWEQGEIVEEVKEEPKKDIIEEIKRIISLDILEQDKEIESLSVKEKISKKAIKKKMKELSPEEDIINKIEATEEKIKESLNYTPEQIKEAEEKFKDKDLLKNIQEELSKTHIGDNNLKMTTFLSATSGLLKNPKRRMSIAVKANTSEGKDNDIKTSLRHMPKQSWIFVTSATQATIEDDIKDKRIIALSEVNANREAGANMYLVEVIKQKAEGGTSSIKKDIREGMKTARHDTGEQASILFGTTESDNDEELGTRFIEGNIKSNYEKIKKVNDNTLDTFSDIDKLLNDSKELDSWIRVMLTKFYDDEEQVEVYLPYAKFLKEQIEEQDIFDHKSPRSQRDLKRILSLTCAMTYLFQLQRQKIYKGDNVILISEPQDLINTLKFTSEFFNQSYSGLDARLNDALKAYEEVVKEKAHLNGWVSRNDIQAKLEVSTNTIKAYCAGLVSEGCLEGIKGKDLNQSEGTKVYDGNREYFKRCQNGIKKPLIRCQLLKLKQFLEEKTQKTFDTFSDICNSDDIEETIEEKSYQNKGIKIEQEKEINIFSEQKDLKNINIISSNSKIDTFSLTPFENQDHSHTEEELIELMNKSISGGENK